MAEPFGLAAGVLQVAAFGAEVGCALWKCAKKIQHANKELKALAGQVDATARCLDSIGNLLKDPETKALHTSKLEGDTLAVAQGCNEVFVELQKASNKFDYDGHKMPMFAKLQWPLNSNKLAEPLKVLKSYSDVLHLMLAVLQIVEGRRAATSKELRALEESLQRLTLANESLSTSNKTLTNILCLQEQSATGFGPGIAKTACCMRQQSLDGLDNKPSMSHFDVPDPPKTGSTRLQKPTDCDPTREHLQRCMHSVQELAKTIVNAMSIWQGHEKTGSTDIHGSHAKLIEELGKLPVELECRQCHGRVPWAEFDLSKVTSTYLGTCTCMNQKSLSLWRPYDPIVSAHSPPSTSDGSFDPYYSQRHGVYTSPRASTDRVIPISSQTYLNPPSVTSASTSSTRLAPGYDAYSGRSRRPSMLENTRSRPTVVQTGIRPSSPLRRDRPDFSIQPASSKESKPSRHFEHKKVYSVDEGSAKIVADVNVVSGGDHHRQKDTGDRPGYRSSGYDRGRKPYHPTGKTSGTVDDDNVYSYTDPASMYKDTEPRWRGTRPRRGSVDRGGASRERPVSMIEPCGADPRRSTREIGPPPSQRGWDKINDLGRSRSTRDQVPHSPSRGARDRDESRGRYIDSRDPYYIAPRKSSADRSRTLAVHQDRPAEQYDHDYDDRREPRHHERKLSATRHKDRSVSRRGSGVRSDSKDRYGTRGSNESFETRPARDTGSAPLNSQYPEGDRSCAQDSKCKEHHRSYEDYDRDSDRDGARKDDGHRHHHRRDSERDDKKDGGLVFPMALESKVSWAFTSSSLMCGRYKRRT